MYLDNLYTSRSTFRYPYKGGDVLSHAEARLKQKCEEEREARELVIKLTRDPKVSPTDRQVEEAKRNVVSAATVVEELGVYVHEFRRNPEREYNLSLGDVVFFGLVHEYIKSDIEAAITPGN
jgi:hypothetical protein